MGGKYFQEPLTGLPFSHWLDLSQLSIVHLQTNHWQILTGCNELLWAWSKCGSSPRADASHCLQRSGPSTVPVARCLLLWLISSTEIVTQWSNGGVWKSREVPQEMSQTVFSVRTSLWCRFCVITKGSKMAMRSEPVVGWRLVERNISETTWSPWVLQMEEGGSGTEVISRNRDCNLIVNPWGHWNPSFPPIKLGVIIVSLL